MFSIIEKRYIDNFGEPQISDEADGWKYDLWVDEAQNCLFHVIDNDEDSGYVTCIADKRMGDPVQYISRDRRTYNLDDSLYFLTEFPLHIFFILHYKSFLQRQLVNFVHEDNNYYYLENDLCEFDIIIIDSGNEYIQAKISLNNKEKYNNIKSNFYLPLNKKAKIMFCGEGNNIKVTKLEIKSFIKYDEDKEKFGIILSEERKECDCCSIV